MKKRMLVAGLLVLTLHTAAAPTASAQNCNNFAQVFTNIWRKWGDIIIAVGCVVKSTVEAAPAAPTGPAAVAAAAALSAKCIKNTQKYKEAIEKAVAAFNDLADNGRATVGPRRIEFGQTQSGNLLGPIDRTFVSVYPMDKDSVSFRIKKLDGQCRTEVVICKISTDGKVTNLSVFEFGKDDPNGKEVTKTVTGVSNHLVQVRLNAITPARRFEYQFQGIK